MNKRSASDQLQAHLLEQCEQLTGHVKLLRDFANSPDGIWLARGELERIKQIATEIEDRLTQIESANKKG